MSLFDWIFAMLEFSNDGRILEALSKHEATWGQISKRLRGKCQTQSHTSLLSLSLWLKFIHKYSPCDHGCDPKCFDVCQWFYRFKYLFFADGNNEGCLGDNYCPPECTCTGTVVRCSHAKLREIPDGIPRETSELYLDVNQIKFIDTDKIRQLKSLTRL